MDRHKSLYKESSFALSPRQHKQMNRDNRNADRAKKRNDVFQSSRNVLENIPNTPISATSTPLLMNGKQNMDEDADKENTKMMEPINNNNIKNSSYASRIAMVSSKSNNTKKLSRQEAFLKRFLNWKDVKKEEDVVKKQCKKPAFVPSGISTVKNTKIAATKKKTLTASFVPKNHPHHFQPPVGLKDPAAPANDEPVSSAASEKLRKSLYTVVPTPTKKKVAAESSIKKAGPHSHFERFNSVPPTNRKAATCTISKTNGFLLNKPTIPTTITKEKPTPAATIIKGKPITTSRITTTKTIIKSTDTKSATNATATSANASAKSFLKPRPLILPPPPPPPPPPAKVIITRKTAGATARVAKPISGGSVQTATTAGACGKVKLLQKKRNDALLTRPTQSHKNAKLAVSLKAKKPTGATAAGAATAVRKFKLKGKALSNPPEELLPIVETPTFLSNVNPYAVFVTSTQFKSSAIESASTLATKSRDDVTKKFGDLSDLISPVEVLEIASGIADVILPAPKRTSASVKRALLQGAGKRKDKLSSPPKVNADKRKFNFVYYSEVDSPMPAPKQTILCTEEQTFANNEALKRAPKNIIGVATITSSASKRASSTTTTSMKQSIGDKGAVKMPSKVKVNQEKFNFVRHSEIVDSPMPAAASKRHQLEQKKDENNLREIVQEEPIVKESAALEKINKMQSNVSTKEDCDVTIVNKELNKVACQLLPTERTPPKDQNSERPANYLSPFVSVSRGKVSAKIEREKRNSIYLQTPPEEPVDFTENKNMGKKQQETEMVAESVEFRRTQETVRYFRKQVADQIERLHDLCDRWEAYKLQELTLLQETAGDDMINVTIGQTKLLTSKKFKQFTGLVDRCEAVALGIAAGSPPINDGSEATKLITVVDLEGFWSMVGLQIDNVIKRFENLERWKANNWIDPDEVKPKAKNNLSKVKKAKTNIVKTANKTAKPTSSLQQMLRKMQAEMRKNKATTATAAHTRNTSNDINNIVQILTPPTRKRRSHSGTPTSVQRRLTNATSTTGRISVIVKDRKSRSAAATIISIPSPASSVSRRRSSLAQSQLKQLNAVSPSLNSSANELKRSLASLQKNYERNDLLKTALVGAATELQTKRKSPNTTDYVVNTPKAQLPASCSPPASALSRKSILKTPGTAKSKPKNVIFNDELRIKKFKFTLESDQSGSDDNEEMQNTNNLSIENLEHEESDKRTYSLRNRKVVLRPSSEFVIPTA